MSKLIVPSCRTFGHLMRLVSLGLLLFHDRSLFLPRGIHLFLVLVAQSFPSQGLIAHVLPSQLLKELPPKTNLAEEIMQNKLGLMPQLTVLISMDKGPILVGWIILLLIVCVQGPMPQKALSLHLVPSLHILFVPILILVYWNSVFLIIIL